MSGPKLFRVFVHPDPLRLEAELVGRIHARREEAGARTIERAFSPILVLAATKRQVFRLREVLAREFQGLLGVDVTHHQGLAYRLAQNVPDLMSPGLAPRVLLETMVRRILEGRPELELSAYAREHPAAFGSITSLIKELREAGIPADAMSRLTASSPGADLAVVLDRYQAAMETLERDGERPLTDRAGLARRAALGAARAAPYDAVYHYGAYELVGMNLDLALALPGREETAWLMPGDPDAPAWSYALHFIRRHLGAEPELLPTAEPRPFVEASRSIRQKEKPAARFDDETSLILAHAQGAEAELTLAARRALSWIDSGIPPHEIAIVARTLDPYMSAAESVFERHGLPVDTSAGLPLSRHSRPRTLVLLLRALVDGFERQTVMDLLRSPAFKRPALSPEALPLWQPDNWDRWSRQYRIVGGKEAWIHDLPGGLANRSAPDWIREDPEELEAFRGQREREAASAGLLGGLIETWEKERAAWQRCTTSRKHAAFLGNLGARWIRDWDGTSHREDAATEITRALAGILDDLQGLDAAVAAADAAVGRASGSSPPRLTPQNVLDFSERAVSETRVPRSHAGGVAFLDVMQARGLVFRHVFLIGFNDDLFPRVPREDPLLPDAIRSSLERKGRPLSLRMKAREEEWVLFAMAVASAGKSLTVSWQRAGADGKVRTRSLYLRELMDLMPELQARQMATDTGAGEFPLRLPTHPARAAACLGRWTGLMTREEAVLYVSDHTAGSGADAVGAFLDRADPGRGRAVAPGLDLIRATEQFSGKDLAYDGALPDGFRYDRPFSSSSLQMLGQCPQTFFFRYALHVRSLDEATEEHRFEARELGLQMHRLLELVYRDLVAQDLLPDESGAAHLADAAFVSLDRHWDETLRPMADRIRPHFPLLYDHAEGVWKDELRAFLRKDLARLASGGHRIDSMETGLADTISLSRGAELLRDREPSIVPGDAGGFAISIRGVPDRITVDRESTYWVGDYKTGGKLETWLLAKEMLHGTKLQIPLYVLLARARFDSEAITGELMGIGPQFFPEGGYVRRDEPLLLPYAELAERLPGLEETLALLALYVREGRFPFRADRHCDWCEFRPACRRHHYPSMRRVTEAPRFRTYFQLQKKSKTKSTLDEAIGSAGEGAPSR